MRVENDRREYEILGIQEISMHKKNREDEVSIRRYEGIKGAKGTGV